MLVNCTLCESSMLQGNYFILVESMPKQVRKKCVFHLSPVFGWTHFAILFVACVSSAAGFWLCSCTALRTFFSWAVKNQIFIFKSMATGQRKTERRLPTATKKLWAKVCGIKVFRANLGKNLCTPQKLPAPTPVLGGSMQVQVKWPEREREKHCHRCLKV